MPLEWLVPVILLALGLWIVAIHRGLARLRRAAILSWEPLERELRERHELVQPLARLALAAAPDRKKPVEAMLQARSAALSTDLSPELAGQAETRLAGAMHRVLGLGATQPDLATDPGFQRIQARLEAVQEEIDAAAEAYNQAAFDYNRVAMRLPGILVAKGAGLPLLEFFALDPAARHAMLAALRGRA